MVETSPLSEQIEKALKEEILTGRLAPGQRINIDELAAKWRVSNMPVRDALKQLEAVGFVEVVPRRGVYVSNFDQKAFRDIFELRIALECLAVDAASRLMPDEEIQCALKTYREAGRRFSETGDHSLLIECDHLVHDLIVQYCGNAKLVSIMEDLKDMIDWARNTIVSRRLYSYETSLPEHIRILEAIQSRNPKSAAEILRAHLENSFNMHDHHSRQGTDHHPG